jgi:hypothetical protein
MFPFVNMSHPDQCSLSVAGPHRTTISLCFFSFGCFFARGCRNITDRSKKKDDRAESKANKEKQIGRKRQRNNIRKALQAKTA